jgi:hypothetical protein
MKKNSANPHFVFLIVLLLIDLILAVYATPVYQIGDAPAYIDMSKFFLGQNSMDFSHRSPLYPLFLAGIIKIFGEMTAIEIMVYIQYILVALTSWMLYKIFLPFFKSNKQAILIALLFNFSFSTIYFANIIITEILTVSIFVAGVMILIKIFKAGQLKEYFFLGIILGLLSLVRFNTVPVVLTFGVLIMIDLIRKKVVLKKWILSLAMIFIPFLIIINSLCAYNYYQHGFYNLFPTAGTSPLPRNVIVASINSGNTVSDNNKPLLEIFLNARNSYELQKKIELKGSLSRFDKLSVLNDLYDGYSIYIIAKPELRKYFNITEGDGEYEISIKAESFYREIYSQNQRFLNKCRFYSLLSSFRAAIGGGLPKEYGNKNLNILPNFSFYLYKAGMLIISLIFFFSFLFYIVRIIKNKFRFDMVLFSLYGLALSFWLINFIFITVNDANRFKFPAEPIIFGVFILSVDRGYKLIKKIVFTNKLNAN